MGQHLLYLKFLMKIKPLSLDHKSKVAQSLALTEKTSCSIWSCMLKQLELAQNDLQAIQPLLQTQLEVLSVRILLERVLKLGGVLEVYWKEREGSQKMIKQNPSRPRGNTY